MCWIPGIDPRIARYDDHAHSRHVSDPGDHSAARNRLLRVRIVETESRHRAELQPRRTRIEEPGDALARQQLAALVEQRLYLRRFVARARFESAQLRDQPQHVIAVALERIRRRVEL
jgi:chorismate mutase